MERQPPLSVLGFCQGDPDSPHSWSGSNRGLFRALGRAGVLDGAFDVEVDGWRRYLGALREYAPDRRAWAQNFRRSPHQFEARTRNAMRILAKRPRPHAVLQVGAMFDATRGLTDVPRFCYLDSNSKLSDRGGSRSFSHFVKGDYKRKAARRERRIYRGSSGVFVFSDFVRRSLIADYKVDPARVHVVYAGVNLTIPPVPRRETPAQPTILFIGRDFERKGGPLLVRAFRRVRAAVPDARLIIGGCNPSISEQGVEVVGFIDKMQPDGERRLADLYARASVFTMPSHFEPFGIVYAEAMHFGLPCVAVDHCAMPEIVTHGVTGLLVPPGREGDLALALITLLREREMARRMGDEGVAKARRLFDWDVVAKTMIECMARQDTGVAQTWADAVV